MPLVGHTIGRAATGRRVLLCESHTGLSTATIGKTKGAERAYRSRNAGCIGGEAGCNTSLADVYLVASALLAFAVFLCYDELANLCCCLCWR